MPYPASSYPEGVDLTIIAGNQLHQVINGEANEVVSTTSGDIPSVRKALADSMMFKVPIDWVQGEVTTDPLETRLYNGQPYWAPEATLANPITLGISPVATTDWLLAPQGYRNDYNLGKYQAGILISDNLEYVVYDGKSYFAVSPPYTTTSTTPDNDVNMFEGGYTTIKSSAEVFSNTNLLPNHNFLIPSPDDITHPSSVATTYSAGTQIFSGIYAGDDGCTITYVNGLVTCTAGSYEYLVLNINGLEYVPNFSSSVAGYDGLPNQAGITHTLIGDEYVITITPEAGSVFTVKFEQGSVATGHEINSSMQEDFHSEIVFDSVSDAKAGGLLSSESIDSSTKLVKTKSYFPVSSGLKPYGGSEYIAASISYIRTITDDPSWSPDGVWNHYMSGVGSGLDYVLYRLSNDDIDNYSWGVSALDGASIGFGAAFYNSNAIRRIMYISDSTGFGAGTDNSVPPTDKQYNRNVVSKLRDFIGMSCGEGFIPPQDPRLIFTNVSTQSDGWCEQGKRIAQSSGGSLELNIPNSLSLEFLVRGDLSNCTMNILIDGTLTTTKTVTNSGNLIDSFTVGYTEGLRAESVVTITPTSGFVEFQGVISSKGGVSGNDNPIFVDRLCRGGAKVDSMLTTYSREIHNNILGAGEANPLSIINLTANDYNQQTDLVTYRAQMQMLIDDCKNGSNGTVILIAGLIRNANLPIPQADYNKVLFELANENERVVYLDLYAYQKYNGGFDYYDSQGFYFDSIHATEGGYYLMASWIYSLVKRAIPNRTVSPRPVNSVISISESNDTLSVTGKVYLMPIKKTKGSNIQRLQLKALSGSSGNLRVAMYDDTGEELVRRWFGEELNYSGGSGVIDLPVTFGELDFSVTYVGVSFSGDISVKGDSDVYNDFAISADVSAGAVPPTISKRDTAPSPSCFLRVTVVESL